eukprot:scaffold6338_cov139-Isochrysis_galbana.AAC.3
MLCLHLNPPLAASAWTGGDAARSRVLALYSRFTVCNPGRTGAGAARPRFLVRIGYRWRSHGRRAQGDPRLCDTMG